MADQKRILQEGFSFVLWYLLEFYMLSTLTWHYELNIPIISNSLGQRESLVQWVTWWSWICLWWKYPRLVGAKWIFLGRRHAQTHKVAPNCRSNLSWWYNCLWRYVFSLLRWTIVSSLWEVVGGSRMATVRTISHETSQKSRCYSNYCICSVYMLPKLSESSTGREN